MSRPVAFTDHGTGRPVNLRASYSARNADDDRATDPGAYRPRALRPARPSIGRWRPTRYASVDGVTWYALPAPRAWGIMPRRVAGPPARVAAHTAAAARGAYARGRALALPAAYAIAAAGMLLAVAASLYALPI
jgi:hypothetical protein